MQNENCRLRVEGRPSCIKCTHCHLDNKHKGLCNNRNNMFKLKLKLFTEGIVLSRGKSDKKGKTENHFKSKMFYHRF